MKSDLSVAWFCAPVSPLFSIGLETESPDALGRLDDKVHQADEILTSWVRTARGRIIASLCMQGAFVVPADEIHDLGRIIDELQAYVGLDYHFGIGLDLHEAFYAVQAAQRKQEPYIFFTDECLKDTVTAEESQDLDSRLNNPEKKQADTLDENALGKAEAEAPVEPQGDIQPVDKNMETRKLIVESLQRIKQHAGSLEALATTNPEAFAAVHGVVQAMVQMAHWLRDGESQDIEKSEALMKKLGLPTAKKLKTPKKPHEEFPDTPGPSAMAGTIKDQKIKGTSNEGKTKWHQATAGTVMGPTGVAVSSREPKAT
jgi:hypothetical protein